MNTSIQIRRINTEHPLFSEVFALREEGLRRPLGLSLYNEDTSGDKEDTIFVALSESVVIGCLMVKPVAEGVLKLRQMIVAAAYQGKGIGRELMLAAEQFAKDGDVRVLTLHARSTAIPFYEKLGYQTEGSVFEEVGIPHNLMTKEL